MKYALKKADKVIVRDSSTGKHKCTITQIKSASLANTQDSVYAEGTDGVRLATYDTNKAATLTFESGVISTGVLQTQIGKDMYTVKNNTKILYRESFKLAAGSTTSVTLTYLASGDTNSEIKWIYKADATGEPGEAYAQAASAGADKFAYAAATGIITLPTDAFSAGDTVIVDYYPTFSTSEVLENNSDAFSITADVYLLGFFTDLSNGTDKYMQVWCPAGRISGAFDFSFGDAVAVQSVTVDANASLNVNHEGVMWYLTTYNMTDAAKVDDD